MNRKCQFKLNDSILMADSLLTSTDPPNRFLKMQTTKGLRLVQDVAAGDVDVIGNTAT